MNRRVDGFTQRIVWLAILASTLVYAALAVVVPHGHTGPARALVTDPRDIAVVVVAAALFITAFWAGSTFKDARGYFAMMALLESASVVGLVGAIKGGDWRIFILPWCLSMIGMIYAYPRASEQW